VNNATDALMRSPSFPILFSATLLISSSNARSSGMGFSECNLSVISEYDEALDI
jgi:hypothetical protein